MAGVVLLLSFLLMPLSASATGKVCGKGGNYTANSTYSSNLSLLAAALPLNASSSPTLFATATAGQSPDAVHALALCRGDTAADSNATASCGGCIADSFRYAQELCPNARAAAVYFEYNDSDSRPGCLLGFSPDAAFLGLTPAAIAAADGSTLFQFWNGQSIPGDAAAVAADVRELLNATARDAAAAAVRRFATVTMDSGSSDIPTLFSLAQCTPDLPAGDCLACLQRLVAMVNDTTAVRQGGRILVLRCNIRFEAFMFYNGESMRRIRPSSGVTPAPPATGPTGKRNGVRPWVIAISVAAPVALVAFGFILYYRRLRRRYTKGKVRSHGKRARKLKGGDELLWEMEAEFSVFDFQQILEATCNFSEENILGEGGFGPVYKGQFPDGMEIAVKRLASHSGQGFIEFKNEVQLIAKLQHRNLVRLLGCCSQGEEKILVYEYLPNKSLDFFIFDEDKKALMDWNKCLAITEGIAEGLLYLHKHSRLCVIHRDLKPSNILLDSKMNPKISDFGLAKIFSSNATDEGNTTRRVVGTYFGVLILEILSGKRNSGSNQCGDFINILGYAWQLWEEGRWIEIVDASLNPKSHSEEIMRCINIALLCVQENAADRPTMLDVVAMLSSKTMILRETKHPAYFNLRVGNEEASTGTQSCSVNDLTISVTTAR
ncbi:cysteine-rich receptor-like protein kinase 10 isoform X1 [Brachypodium distachyon]|uniref:Protein kinase domain-containing protein n=1 Tax=Brachypodium distachyon TaxID=15368 RepID=A0A0Q3I7A3_BRADI|nr:cysteine-rich receptor-like protein kinase 10 isoform X1 [Brachypodium distachyon]KQJ81936.1 hypothetical protein BRADI_5g03930v3 [Brachypodium distachyon]|eukprot:XP_010239724.1 cysteine-rich receptor-like protein kinase 10 isoform X1 [Brachypodium distachyon]